MFYSMYTPDNVYANKIRVFINTNKYLNDIKIVSQLQKIQFINTVPGTIYFKENFHE